MLKSRVQKAKRSFYSCGFWCFVDLMPCQKNGTSKPQHQKSDYQKSLNQLRVYKNSACFEFWIWRGFLPFLERCSQNPNKNTFLTRIFTSITGSVYLSGCLFFVVIFMCHNSRQIFLRQITIFKAHFENSLRVCCRRRKTSFLSDFNAFK